MWPKWTLCVESCENQHRNGNKGGGVAMTVPWPYLAVHLSLVKCIFAHYSATKHEHNTQKWSKPRRTITLWYDALYPRYHRKIRTKRVFLLYRVDIEVNAREWTYYLARVKSFQKITIIVCIVSTYRWLNIFNYYVIVRGWFTKCTKPSSSINPNPPCRYNKERSRSQHSDRDKFLRSHLKKRSWEAGHPRTRCICRTFAARI